MADAWVLWLGIIIGTAFAVLLTAAGVAIVGLFLGAVIVIAARSAVRPTERQRVEKTLRNACNRLPYCDCGHPPSRP